MSDATPWLVAVRRSHDHLTSLVADLGPEELGRPSACSEWTIAQVLSHLGSQAVIFSLFVDAGITGGAAPAREAFGPIWDTWNARSPLDQATESVKANEALVSLLEGLDPETLRDFRLEMFGRTLDAAGLLRMRLSEHAVHTWDVAVTFDPTVAIANDAVELLVDGLAELASRSGRPLAEPLEATVITVGPRRLFRLQTSEAVLLEPTETESGTGRSIELPAEAFLRLLYGRLGDDHPAGGTVHADGITLSELTNMFPGF
jgi:uncharacterized protein (TIGR03083 family)